jgi:hypothetical protein
MNAHGNQRRSRCTTASASSTCVIWTWPAATTNEHPARAGTCGRRPEQSLAPWLKARMRELSEALKQQTETPEVLQVISSSPGELQPVFEAMLANATRLCDASYGAMWLCEGDACRCAALHDALPSAYIEQWHSGTVFRPGSRVPLARVAKTRQPVQVPDLLRIGPTSTANH